VLDDVDERFRAAAFAYLDRVVQRSDGLVTRSELESFAFDGRLVRLIAPRSGIWRPAGCPAAVSFFTRFTPISERPPYDDHVGEDGFPRYKWRGHDPDHADNVALRQATQLQKPLIWLRGIRPGLYQPEYPVWLAGEEPKQEQFVVALVDQLRDLWTPGLVDALPHNPVRLYAMREVKARLHQPLFRTEVLLAYDSQCALCRLRYRRLLDAAHIREDADGGEPVVPNGVAMCAIHHRAFDADVLGVRPDYKIEIRSDVLREHDGPTLQHALQGLHGVLIELPKRTAQRPNPDLLEERYERFRAAG